MKDETSKIWVQDGNKCHNFSKNRALMWFNQIKIDLLSIDLGQLGLLDLQNTLTWPWKKFGVPYSTHILGLSSNLLANFG